MTPSPPHAIADAAALADELVRARVLAADQIADLVADFRGATPADLGAHLVARGALTRYQADRALAGAARALALGPYRVIGPHRLGALGPAVAAEKAGGGTADQVVLAAVPLRSLWRAKQARELARRAAALKPHPAVVPLLDAGSANGFHYLVWPRANGDRLADRVAAAGPLDPPAVAALLAELAAGLAGCHAAGLPHGLLSPAAVALAAGAAPARVLDLGAGLVLGGDLAGVERLLDTATAGGALARFLPYAAPEWLAAPGAPTAAADQYSLGAVGYFALTGRPPAPEGDAPVVVPGVPRALVATLDRLMAADPAHRFSGMNEAHAALALVAADGDATAEVRVDPDHEPTGSTAPGGSVSWGGGGVRPAARDDSDDSVRFDLPDEAEAPALNGPPETVPAAAWTPVRLPDPAPTPPPAPRSWTDEDRLPVVAPPRLPAAPLLAPTPPAPAPAARAEPDGPAPAPVAAPEPAESEVWRRVRRKVMFWKPATDAVRVHVYGPPTAARSEAPRLTVFLFQPGAADSVATLARAFGHTAVLLGTGSLAQEVSRGEALAVHLALAGVSVTTPLRTVKWQGNPCRAEFDLLVSWEAPLGTAAGVVSVGRDQVRIGKTEFPLVVTDSRGSHMSIPGHR